MYTLNERIKEFQGYIDFLNGITGFSTFTEPFVDRCNTAILLSAVCPKNVDYVTVDDTEKLSKELILEKAIKAFDEIMKEVEFNKCELMVKLLILQQQNQKSSHEGKAGQDKTNV